MRQMTKPIFIGHDIYRDSTYGSGHPLAIPRVSLAIDLARAMGWFDQWNYRESPMAGLNELADFHTIDYLEALKAAETEPPSTDVQKKFNIGANGNPVFREMFRRPATACGGGLLATALLKNEETTAVYNIAGGQHHGMPSHASGFCYLNEPALTIRRLKKLGARRVFYLDLDAHFGDGVQGAFGDDAQVAWADWPMHWNTHASTLELKFVARRESKESCATQEKRVESCSMTIRFLKRKRSRAVSTLI